MQLNNRPFGSARNNHRSLLLSTIALGVAFVAVWLAGSLAGSRALGSVVSQGRASAALHAAVLRSELQKFRLVPLALADDPEARAALESRPLSIAGLDRRLEHLNAGIRAAAIYLVDATGRTLAASNWNQPLSFVGSNYHFRAYFREALARGSFEQFALGTVSRIPGLYIARRVRAANARGVVVLKVEFDELEAEWAQSGSPAFVTDPRGIVLITSVPAWRFLTERPIDSAHRAAIRRNLDFGDAPLTPLPIAANDRPGVVTVTSPGDDGRQRYVETLTPTGTPGWTLHVLTPVGTSVADAANIARLVTAIMLILGWVAVTAVTRLRRRRRQNAIRQAADRAALEAEVESRTADLRDANRHLLQEMADRRLSEANLQAARDQLVQANKLASLGQITAGVAHEINQPVAAIRSYADNGRLLLERDRVDDLAANLDRIVSMTERIGAITSELRGFARKARGTTGPIAIADAIDGALLLLRDRIDRQKVRIVSEGARDAQVLGERVRLEQVLMNLLVNALEAMERTGGKRIAIAIGCEAARTTLDITDDGPGVGVAALADLFRPFATTKDQGLGLGLIISRDIMRDLGGDLTYEAGGIGARFRLWLRAA